VLFEFKPIYAHHFFAPSIWHWDLFFPSCLVHSRSTHMPLSYHRLNKPFFFDRQPPKVGFELILVICCLLLSFLLTKVGFERIVFCKLSVKKCYEGSNKPNPNLKWKGDPKRHKLSSLHPTGSGFSFRSSRLVHSR